MPSESLNLPYLTLSGIVFLTIIVSFVVYKPQIEHWRSARSELKNLTEQLTERRLFLATVDQKSAELQANAASEQELSVVLPPDESFDDVLRIIDRQAAAAAVHIKGVDNTTANIQTAIRVAKALGNERDTSDTLTVHGASVQLDGSYQQIRQFFSLLENAVRLMDIPAITLSQSPTHPDILEGTLSVEFYSLSGQR